MVKVGTGSTAFWIDRYESSVYGDLAGTGTPNFQSDGDFPSTFPRNGQATLPLFAVSRTSVTPARFITWFQAVEACRASGKRMPTGEEWLAAGRGTADSSTGCNVATAPGAGPRTTGLGRSCSSAWGAEDLIGNLGEWNVEWDTGVSGVSDYGMATPWPSDYNGDRTAHIASSAYRSGAGGWITGLPSAVTRADAGMKESRPGFSQSA